MMVELHRHRAIFETERGTLQSYRRRPVEVGRVCARLGACLIIIRFPSAHELDVQIAGCTLAVPLHGRIKLRFAYGHSTYGGLNLRNSVICHYLFPTLNTVIGAADEVEVALTANPLATLERVSLVFVSFSLRSGSVIVLFLRTASIIGAAKSSYYHDGL